MIIKIEGKKFMCDDIKWIILLSVEERISISAIHTYLSPGSGPGT